jgi:hypothetical protein
LSAVTSAVQVAPRRIALAARSALAVANHSSSPAQAIEPSSRLIESGQTSSPCNTGQSASAGCSERSKNGASPTMRRAPLVTSAPVSTSSRKALRSR